MGVARLKRGDRVRWRSFGEQRVGRVVRKLVAPSAIHGRKVAASPALPQYLVRSEASGRTAALARRALKPFP
ncbi:MAG: DUF2945 domain-containing protein [Hyphomicrobiales bacterium]|nr:DUF2945 domain-containing protein [Hyphomicrobiales bacterium]